LTPLWRLFSRSYRLDRGGCSLGADPGPMAQLDTVNVPNIAALAAKIQDTFKAVKLTGYPRVSQVRKASVSALGDWVICLRSDAESEPRVLCIAHSKQ